MLVLYDDQCRFCRLQVTLIRHLDLGNRLRFLPARCAPASLAIAGITPVVLQREMVVLTAGGEVGKGIDAIRLLSRQLPLLWPLAALLHLPGSYRLWRWMYRAIARNRYLLGRVCGDQCAIPAPTA